MDWIEKGNRDALCEGGIHQRGCCAKSIEGDQSASRESLTADDRQPMGAESIRLADSRLLPNQSKFMPNTTRTYADTGAAQAVAGLDPFLHGQTPSYIGGVVVEDAEGGPVMGYRYVEPSADKRGDENFAAREESGIADAAGFRPATPGLVGGREPSSYVVKSGTFRSVIEDPSNASGFGEPR
jgi:hypothetical protein